MAQRLPPRYRWPTEQENALQIRAVTLEKDVPADFAFPQIQEAVVAHFQQLGHERRVRHFGQPTGSSLETAERVGVADPPAEIGGDRAGDFRIS